MISFNFIDETATGNLQIMGFSSLLGRWKDCWYNKWVTYVKCEGIEAAGFWNLHSKGQLYGLVLTCIEFSPPYEGRTEGKVSPTLIIVFMHSKPYSFIQINGRHIYYLRPIFWIRISNFYIKFQRKARNK